MARGKRIITKPDGDEIEILFTNQALAEAEHRMQKSIIEVSQGLTNGKSGITEVANLLRAGWQAANRDNGNRGDSVSLHQAYKLMDEVGYKIAMIAVMEAVTDILTFDSSEGN